MTTERFFLGIKQSATGQKWVDRLGLREANTALAIAQHHGITDLVARVLAGRGVSVEGAPEFVDPTLRNLMPDPATLTDMDNAAGRIADAILRRETVAIFGDYDVDGACSSALMSRFLKHYGIPHSIYIPDRIFEGYGPNPDAMRDLVAKGATLIVTVDCGTNSAPSITAAKQAGADVVVLDHHQVGGDLPEDAVAIVNPNREDDISLQGHLCAAGVVFLTLVQVTKILRERGKGSGPDLLSLLDLVALATVCDVVPLTGVNRAFVVKGLLVARSQSNVGLAALARVSRIGEPLNVFHLGYLIGPRINAGGRIGDAGLGARLLTLDDPATADRIAVELDRLNQERQAMEAEMLMEAEAEASLEISGGAGASVIVTASDRWHPGIVGLLASRLKEKARRPAFAIAFNANGVGSGSGRSIMGLDLGKLVRGAMDRGLLVKGGGHAMAAGITIERGNLGALRAYLEEESAHIVSRLRENQSLSIDGALAASGATVSLYEALQKAGPYGSAHPQPILALPHHILADVRGVGRDHVRVTLRGADGKRVNAIAFRAAEGDLGRFLFNNIGQSVHVAGNLSLNHWNGSVTPQIQILDAALPI
ncbi:single-stranded-DNA-specific exonuclease RecJ [Brucella intermedia]|uniref:Single-stranded-DNA-specific exonuclease RecJ n=1 Tax=Brucella intermedia TaxID=94625 RepID=A0A7V6U0S4_9HYPH|nr:single-stranded-DNA-specific exonuclease RecJ [Brucella intermedia]PJR94439.1 single-stranded-DNA-specific exonuclease RecJ [Ochrobactrum sp. 721/2009]PJT17723.1 single-stranded-DNA-specific exonuclease RecJ [Ochrobactrum sp. 720/2009]PJT21148.1 single-stranded-DNA-specific exonuclease RecJ [Ochrobactrum sp. 715/2009]PJT31071.1 single-stranded-DNA-specific exonuclease RecJ [Ochrobactrum sp. 695/2009]PJT33085.1 single-stranded-DNA-specific exonuclease RecJ [Ochrobactrum sp. 689/2009]